MDQETRRRRLIIFAVALAAIGVTYATILVAQEEEMDEAIWYPMARQTAGLLDFLHQHSFGDEGNFKNGTFDEAAGVVEPFLDVSSPTALLPPLTHCCT
jgi:hypothetical protein